jgi:hypothetical protein
MTSLHGIDDINKKISNIENILANQLDIKIGTPTKTEIEVNNIKSSLTSYAVRLTTIEEQISSINSALLKLKREFKK